MYISSLQPKLIFQLTFRESNNFDGIFASVFGTEYLLGRATFGRAISFLYYVHPFAVASFATNNFSSRIRLSLEGN